MDTAHIQITAQPVGGRVKVNGRDITDDIVAATFRLGQAEPTVLSVHMKAGADPTIIEGRGIVQVVADGIDPAQAIVEFLSQIDPAEIEQAALMRDDLGHGNVTAKVLAITIERAEAAG